MRSRTRNRHFIFAVFQLIIPLLWSKEDYLIGYRLHTQNAILSADIFQTSKAMLPCHGEAGITLTLPREPAQTFESVIKNNKTLFLETFASEALHIQSYSIQNSLNIRDENSLTLKTQCYAVEINQDFVTITHIQETQK